MTDNPLLTLGRLGQSPWYDFITRELLQSGKLARLIAEDGLRGMTSNPTIFEKAISGSEDYDEDIRRLIAEGRQTTEIFDALSIADVQTACDSFRPSFDALEGRDGFVSIEVSPELANDTSASIAEASRLWHAVDRPNVMVKIPGTAAGIPAIEESLANGININITLLFSVERYLEVIEAFLRGLERRRAQGFAIDRLASVASFFVSRVDGKIDPLLDQAGDPRKLRGSIAIANAAMAYSHFEGSLQSERWQALAAAGARPQRPLWASTSTKDPRYSDTHYIEPLVAPHTVTTLPPDTFDAYRDHGKPEVRIAATMQQAPARLRALAAQGIDLAAITHALEDEGVAKFSESYRKVLSGIEAKATALVGAHPT